MIQFFESLVIAFWNWLQGRSPRKGNERGMTTLGFRFMEGRTTGEHVGMSATRRTMHLAVLGKTGTGKSSLLKHLAVQDIASGKGWIFFDLHGDATQYLLRAVAAEETRRQESLADRLIVIAPADTDSSVGLNPLEDAEPDFVRVAEFSEVLRQRWGLDHFGARTDELLRNALYVLSANGLTLLELAPLLIDAGFRTKCLEAVPNAEVRHYFSSRYGAASAAMQATMREPILNKTSAFTADPRFRHMMGQVRSTFSLREAMDKSSWIIFDLPKGKLGGQALTVASLGFTIAKHALFTRTRRTLFTLYCDEIQNLVAQSADVETALSEARKFGIGIVSANQFLDQYPASMRAAILSVGTHAFFQLSVGDAPQVAQMLDGGKALAERLKNLPPRHFVLKSGADLWVEAVVPQIDDPKTNTADLVRRSRAAHARPRAEVEREIVARHEAFTQATNEVLHDWE